MDAASMAALLLERERHLDRYSDCFSRRGQPETLRLYVRGQLSDLERKSIEPMALEFGVPPRSIQQFLSQAGWDHEMVRARTMQILREEYDDPESVGITEALWGTRTSASTVSTMAQKVYGSIEAWRNRPITGEHSYVYLDGIWLKRSWGGEAKNVAVLIAIGVDSEGFREMLGWPRGPKRTPRAGGTSCGTSGNAGSRA